MTGSMEKRNGDWTQTACRGGQKSRHASLHAGPDRITLRRLHGVERQLAQPLAGQREHRVGNGGGG
ncbi:hypothetical protein, partial [Ralstonia solanacearum]|uniref:hypothetical protein n=1 Tax=Ralstonia solanacearum TaxID=305 RepID=UPI001E5069D7